MVDAAKLLMGYRRLVSKDAATLLDSDPDLMVRLEGRLKDGSVRSPIIKMTDLTPLLGPEPPKSQTMEAPPIIQAQATPPLSGQPAGPTGTPGEEGPDLHKDVGGSDGVVRSGGDLSVGPVDVPMGPRPVGGDHTTQAPRTEPGPRADGWRPRPLASEFSGGLKVLKDPFEKMGTQGKIEDFRKLFMDRYRNLRRIIVGQHADLSPCMEIDRLDGSEEQVRIVGMVSAQRTTKNGHRMLDVEDTTGAIKVLISKTKKEIASVHLVEDEVIGVIGKFSSGEGRGGSIIFADNIVKVDLPGIHRRRTSEEEGILAAFTSDIHIGSRMYLDKEWRRMVRWLRGEEDASMKASEGSRVKYLVIAGDLVDGIGVYPDQENDLAMRDISRQYEALAESLSMVPEHVEIVLIPGNHDAVRLAEPQPSIPMEYQEFFSNTNIHFLSNPTLISLSGVHVALYHGRSLDDLVTQFKDVTYENPIEGMKEMLRFRHYSPTYGMRNQIAPEEVDHLIIDDIPDIFVTGHVHRFDLGNYKGVQLVQGSAWQSQTPFQKMMNFKPQPAKMGIIELSSADKALRWEIP